MDIKKLKQIHQKVKDHPFRLDHSKDWKGYYLLLKELEESFFNCLEELHKEEKSYSEWDFFIHELRGAIWHFQFEFNEDSFNKERGRVQLTPDTEEEKKIYGIIIPEFQKKITVILENYIQQIHKFIITKTFEEFITYYTGCENWEDENRSEEHTSELQSH